MATQAEIAWAAGLFEGEGCISFGSSNPDYRLPKMQITMSDRDVLLRFERIVAAGSVSEKPFQRAEHHKRQWSWRAHGRVAHAVYLMLRPWLCSRRQGRGDEVFTYLSDKGPGGHPLTRIAPDGQSKACTGCGQMKSLEEFAHSNTGGRLGRASRCRDCRHLDYKIRWERDKEKIRAQNREAQRRRRAELSRRP